jgi:phosphoglucosamine mutase
VLAADREGGVHDGDELIALAAGDLRRRGTLDGGVAVTVMTNYGFLQAMEKAGIEVATTQVGDRYVLAELQKRGWSLGGEQSGHIISMDFAPTGDGIAAALLSLRALDGADLGESRPFRKLPQRLSNVEVSDRSAVEGATAVWEAVEAEGAALEGRGRVLVRPSGTEPLVRVMVEAPSEGECEEVCERLVAVVREQLAS